MKPISETKAIGRLNQIKADLRSKIAVFESRAKSCLTCETPGACCLDAHFVNVHISRLEAESIRNALKTFHDDLRIKVNERIADAIATYGLAADHNTFSRTYACPLFEKGIGCLVHSTAKPVACIVHACYENKADLPSDTLQNAAEEQIDALNTRVYGRAQSWLPLPVAISYRRGGA